MATDNASRLAAAEAFFAEKCKPRFPEDQVPSIKNTSELVQKIEESKVLLVDLRSPEEQGISKLPSSITKDQFEELLASDAANGKLDVPTLTSIVVHCAIGGRSGSYVKEHRERVKQRVKERVGKDVEVYNYELSLVGWTHAGQKLVDASGAETKKVHAWGPNFVNMYPEECEVTVEPKPS
eukprot:TRINITY_DN79933_c0_g1_i1.p1 TRINITY_DN79933_c0_g1~~TRINITY_DN79933_c0_g1_i1.p1  ORF type:complete len:181 (+),score=35.36 TRINITY_DN79933_c0_g1_i1:59-601(+)